LQLAKRLDNFAEYIFFRLNQKVREVEARTSRKVLNFGPGSPDFPPSKQCLAKLHQFIDAPQAHMYPGYGPIPEFTQALISWYQARFNVQIQSDELYPLIGAKDGISHLVLALLDPGDEVLVPDPGYPGYTGSALLVDAKPVYYNLLPQNNFKIDFTELAQKITSKTKFMWVNFPSNPLGAVTNLTELTKIVQFARKHSIWLIYDNAYSEITYDNYIAPSILEIPEAKEVAIEIGSCSKMFSFAGYRIGWASGNRRLIAALAKVKSQVDSGLPKPLQQMAAYAFTHPDYAWQKAMLQSYQLRRDLIATRLKKLGLTFELPLGSLYIWAKIPDAYSNSEEFVLDTLSKKHILFTPGTAYGQNGERYVRVSVCVNIDHIDEYF
jgi:LL-diaminopimelate aminotransferase